MSASTLQALLATPNSQGQDIPAMVMPSQHPAQSGAVNMSAKPGPMQPTTMPTDQGIPPIVPQADPNAAGYAPPDYGGGSL